MTMRIIIKFKLQKMKELFCEILQLKNVLDYEIMKNDARLILYNKEIEEKTFFDRNIIRLFLNSFKRLKFKTG